MMNDPANIPAERIERAIIVLRGHRVMLDADLAVLYGVTTKRVVGAPGMGQFQVRQTTQSPGSA